MTATALIAATVGRAINVLDRSERKRTARARKPGSKAARRPAGAAVARAMFRCYCGRSDMEVMSDRTDNPVTGQPTADGAVPGQSAPAAGQESGGGGR